MTWEERWREGRTGWDAGRSPPALRQALDSGVLQALLDWPTARVLVPGAGAGYDVVTFAGEQRQVIGLDIAPSAEQRFRALTGASESDKPSAAGMDYWVGDFFDYQPSAPFDLAWDYTFFCALAPELRSAFSETLWRALRPGGLLLTLMFPLIEDTQDRTVSRDEGPPYPLSQAIYLEHLTGPDTSKPRFLVEHTFENIESHPGREGKEILRLWRRQG